MRYPPIRSLNTRTVEALSRPRAEGGRFYPLPDWMAGDDGRLKDLPVTLVKEGNDWGLTLTQYRDPSASLWELCEAYMRFGYLPPFALVEGGMPMSLKTHTGLVRWVMAGARESARTMAKRARTTVLALQRQRKGLPPA